MGAVAAAGARGRRALRLSEDGHTLERRDEAGRTVYSTAAPGDWGLLAAGRFFGRTEGDVPLRDSAFVMGNADTGETVARFPAVEGRYPRRVALSESGVYAAITGSTEAWGPHELEWRSVADPEPHVLDVVASAYAPLAVAADAILTEVVIGRRPSAPTRLSLLGLDGSRATIARYPGESWIAGADWDGRRVVWAQGFCGRRLFFARPGARPERVTCDSR